MDNRARRQSTTTTVSYASPKVQEGAKEARISLESQSLAQSVNHATVPLSLFLTQFIFPMFAFWRGPPPPCQCGSARRWHVGACAVSLAFGEPGLTRLRMRI